MKGQLLQLKTPYKRFLKLSQGQKVVSGKVRGLLKCVHRIGLRFSYLQQRHMKNSRSSTKPIPPRITNFTLSINRSIALFTADLASFFTSPKTPVGPRFLAGVVLFINVFFFDVFVGFVVG